MNADKTGVECIRVDYEHFDIINAFDCRLFVAVI